MGTAHIERGQARSSVAHRRDSGACVRLLDGFEVREGRYVFDLPANMSRHGDPLSPRRTAAPRLRSRRLVAGHCGRAGRCKLALGVVEAPSLGTHLVQASRGRLTLDSHVRVDLCELLAVARRVLEPTHELQGGELEMLMFAGELLPDWCDDWLVVDREQRHQMRLHALEQLSDRLAAAGRPPRAAGLCGHCCNAADLTLSNARIHRSGLDAIAVADA